MTPKPLIRLESTAQEDLEEEWIRIDTDLTFDGFVEELQRMSFGLSDKYETRKIVPAACTLCDWAYTSTDDRDRHLRTDRHLLQVVRFIRAG